MARITVSRGAILSHWGDLSGAIEVSETGLSQMTALGDTMGIVGAAFALAQAYWYCGRLREARDLLTAHLPHARSEAGQARGRERRPSCCRRRRSFAISGACRAKLGDTGAGFAALSEARAAAHRHGHAFDQTLVTITEGRLLQISGQLAPAIEVLERAMDVTQANRFEWHLPMIACALGTAYIEAGRPGDALPLLQAGAAIADRSRHVGKRLLCNPPLIRVLASPQEAADLASDTLRQAGTSGFRPVLVQTHIATGHRMLAAGNRAAAEVALRAAFDLASEIGPGARGGRSGCAAGPRASDLRGDWCVDQPHSACASFTKALNIGPCCSLA